MVWMSRAWSSMYASIPLYGAFVSNLRRIEQFSSVTVEPGRGGGRGKIPIVSQETGLLTYWVVWKGEGGHTFVERVPDAQ
jgi:hypothetical protein